VTQSLLLIALLVAHWFGDFTPLSTPWMLNAKRFGKPLFPIFVHAGVHAVLVAVVLFFYCDVRLLAVLAGFEWITHFFIDVLKGRLQSVFPVLNDVHRSPFWMLFGADQFLHILVLIIISHLAIYQQIS